MKETFPVSQKRDYYDILEVTREASEQGGPAVTQLHAMHEQQRHPDETEPDAQEGAHGNSRVPNRRAGVARLPGDGFARKGWDATAPGRKKGAVGKRGQQDQQRDVRGDRARGRLAPTRARRSRAPIRQQMEFRLARRLGRWHLPA